MDEHATAIAQEEAESARIGDRLLRREDERLLRGAGCFIEDMVLPGEARAIFVRSPVAHARIDRIDLSAARSAPGVLAVLTGAEVVADGLGGVPWEVRPPSDAPDDALPPIGDPSIAEPQPLIAHEVTRYVGEIVAMVVAETETAARDAAERIDFAFSTLPAYAKSADAAAGATPIWTRSPDNEAFVIRMGDPAAVDSAIAAAAHVETLDCESNRIFGGPIEVRGYIGDYDAAADRMILHASAGKPHTIRKTMAALVFGVPLEQIAVKVPDIGGGFGIKNVLYPEECLVMWTARRLGRPVKWIGRRDESFLSDVGCREQTNHGEMAFDRDGNILAVRVRSLGNLGAYLAPRGVVSLRNSGFVLSNVYAFPNVDYEMRGLYTNTVPTCNFRGAGEPEGIYITERLVDAGARALGLDPVDIRRRNLMPPDDLPRINPVGLGQDTGDYAAVLDAAVDAADRAGFVDRRDETEAGGRLRGWGMSMHLLMSGFGYNEATRLVVQEDGSIDLLIGSQSSGQGHATVFAQLAAAQLGIGIDRVRVIQGDTDRILTGTGTGASRSLTIGGTSTVMAADALVKSGRDLACHLLEAAADDIRYRQGMFEVAGTDRRLSLGEVARRTATSELPPGLGPDFSASAEYQPEHGTSACGCNICEVVVDPETGSVELDRYVLVQDVGCAINPVIVEGQMHGGAATGAGQALCEHALYDPDTAQLVTGSFMDYALPRADDVPSFELLLQEVPSAHNPLGAKGIGEAGGAGTAPAIVNAVLDALAPLGVCELDMPLTSHRVWEAIRAAQNPAS